MGKQISREERKNKNYQSPTLVYGEIEFWPFAEVFLRIKEKYGGLSHKGGVFVDIGCGTGKPVMAAALLHDFDICLGVEILENLVSACHKVLDVWKWKIIRDVSYPDYMTEEKTRTQIDFLHTDATTLDWKAADVVFANSTCFNDALMTKISVKCDELKPGAFVITTTRAIENENFEILEVGKMGESWGEATVFIQRKIGAGGSSLGSTIDDYSTGNTTERSVENKED